MSDDPFYFIKMYRFAILNLSTSIRYFLRHMNFESQQTIIGQSILNVVSVFD